MTSDTLAIVTVTMEDREDGGLRTHSSDLPGLICSGPDKAHVIAQTRIAIKAIFEHLGRKVVDVRPAHYPIEALKLPSPRNVQMQVHCERFVVEYLEAA